MKICVTFPRTDQVGPDEFKVWNAVVHVEPEMTMREVAERLTGLGVTDCELHIERGCMGE